MPTCEVLPVTRITRPGAKKRGLDTPGYGRSFRLKKSAAAPPTASQLACRMK